MAIKVNQIYNEKLVSISNPKEIIKERQIFNPFRNMLEMVSFYFEIYKNEDIEKLKDFVGTETDETSNKIGCIDMYQNFVTSMYYSSIDPDETDEWMMFDSNEMDILLQDPFFDEYNRTRHFYKSCRRNYPMLDVYSFFRLQAYASTVLPKNMMWDVNYIWTFEDFIDQMYGLKWFDMISTVYQSYGIHWFSNNGENDPIMYKWACYAVSACKKANKVSDEILKRDLSNIYKELLIAFTIRESLEKNKDIVDYVWDCINNFDEEKINGLMSNINNLQRERDQLLDEKKQLNEGLTLLRKQVEELQEDSQTNDFEKVEEIALKIYCLSPQNSKLDNKVEQFKSVWDKLDESTKKDIKLSISMFEQFESFDLALFPMIRSLEHEFARNFFEPFQCSKYYKNAGLPSCSNKYYEKTHDSLVKKSNSYPTMGNIIFIGKAMTDVKAQESSNIINAFRVYLGESRKAFVSICKALDTYKLGTKQYRLVDIRNGIAHGNKNVINDIDKKIYEEVSRLLYEMPLQILFEIIKYSLI